MMFHRRPRDERGATAVLVALMAIILFGAAALAVDYSSLAMERQNLHDHIDSAAQSGAFELPSSGASAAAAARSIATAQDGDLSFDSDDIGLYCVVSSVGTAPLWTPNLAQIGPSGTCYPGPAPYSLANYAGMRCNASICAIPCPQTGTGIKCNTVKVSYDKSVPYSFARIFGINTGQTGSVASAACKGSCGEDTPNPLDVVVVADRTPSMGANLTSLQSSIQTMMRAMDPTMHILALATIDAAAEEQTQTNLLTSSGCASTGGHKARVIDHFPNSTEMKVGSWMATQFSNTYGTRVGTTTTLNDKDRVTNAVKCLEHSSGYYRTHLAAPLRSAVQHLYDESETNLGALSASMNRPGTVRKVIIFETDGQPLESASSGGNLNVSTVEPMGVNEPRSTSEATACQNLKNVANAAKNKGALIITVGFGDAATGDCGSQSTASVLASVATDSATSGCDTATKRSAENVDGDNFFCATSGAELAPIFATAFNQLQTGIKLINLP